MIVSLELDLEKNIFFTGIAHVYKCMPTQIFVDGSAINVRGQEQRRSAHLGRVLGGASGAQRQR